MLEEKTNNNQWRLKMKKTKETATKEDSTKKAVLHLAFELSDTKR